MSDALDDRRRALEEEYFRRKDKESLDKLREALRQEAQEKDEAEARLRCPRCGAALAETDCEGVEVDHCEQCGGVWLDAGELELVAHQYPGGMAGRLIGMLRGSRR